MSEAMDNFTLHVIACSKEALDHAVALAYLGNGSVVAWAEELTVLNSLWLKLFWSVPDSWSAKTKPARFPIPLTQGQAVDLIWSWLKKHKPLEDAPDIDGSTSRGFEITGGKGGDYEVLRVRSIWAEHHK